MSNPILALTPSGYKGQTATAPKVYSVLPSDGSGDFTFDRANGLATRINKDGLVEEVANDTPRLDYLNGTCPSLLLEAESTNNFTYSEDYSQSVWVKSNSTITSFVGISPNGELNASLLTSTGTNGGLFRFAAWTTTQRTISFFVKKENSETVQIWNASANTNNVVFNLDTGVIISEGGSMTGVIKPLKNNWYRISATHTATGSQTFGVIPEDSKSVYVWGGQMENKSFESSYIPTISSTATRFVDICKDAGNADLFNVSELSLFFDVNNFKPDTGSFSYIVLTDGQSSPINMIRFDYKQDRIVISNYVNGTLGFFYTITSVVPNQRNKMALTISTARTKVYFNGVLKITTAGDNIPSGLNSLSFTNRTKSGGYFEGEVQDARVYDRVLTETEAIKLTT